MRKTNIEVMTAAQISAFDRMRREVVERRFNDERLFELFKLSPRPAAFAREYAIVRNSEQAARLAGYSPKTARKSAARMVKMTASAVQAIRGELANMGAEFRAGLSEYLANGLLEIFQKRNEYPGAAVYAARELRRIYIETKTENEPLELLEAERNTDTKEIEDEIKKMGIYG